MNSKSQQKQQQLQHPNIIILFHVFTHIGKVNEIAVNIFISNSSYRVFSFLSIMKFPQCPVEQNRMEYAADHLTNLMTLCGLWKSKQNKSSLPIISPSQSSQCPKHRHYSKNQNFKFYSQSRTFENGHSYLLNYYCCVSLCVFECMCFYTVSD